jgi:hypothetical protein
VLLELLAAEAAPELPPWYLCIDTLALHLTTTPSRCVTALLHMMHMMLSEFPLSVTWRTDSI